MPELRTGDDRSGQTFLAGNLAGGVVSAGLSALILWLVLPLSGSAPEAMGALIGLAFLLVAGVCLRRAGRGLRCVLRRRADGGRNAHQPWVIDFPRGEAWARESTLDTVVTLALAALLVGLLLIPFHWMAFFSEGQVRWGWGAAVLALDLIPLLLLAASAAWAVHHRRHGHTTLGFGRFPLRRGRQLQMSLQASRAPLRFDRLELILRCVQWDTVRQGNKVSPRAVQVHAQRKVLNARQCATREAGPIRFTFQLPPDAPGTRLDASPHRYWELLVAGSHDNGSETHMGFLVPIYGEEHGPGKV